MTTTTRSTAALPQPSSAAPSGGAPVPGRRRWPRPAAPGALAPWLALATLLGVACGMGTAPSGNSASGTVTGEGAAGVTITVSGGPTGFTGATGTTGGSGGWSIGGLEYGTYVATASRAGSAFAPHDGHEFQVAGADVNGLDFLATATHHAIRGTITGVTVAGVRLEVAGASAASTTSASDGGYAFLQVLDGAYTVTPSLAGHGFSPGALTVTLSGADAAGQDFTSSVGGATQHAIAGAVTGAVRAGVTVTLQGGTGAPATEVTDAAGAFAFTGLADGAYQLTPTRAGFDFTPRSLAVTLGGADAPAQRFLATASAPALQVDELATGGHLASGIAIGNDLNAWITDASSGVVSRVRLQDTTDGPRGQVADLYQGPAGSRPTAIALRFFGLRCFTETGANRIGCLDWAGDLAFTVAIPTPASGAMDIVNGPGASQLSPDMWFAEHDAGKVGRLVVTVSAGAASGVVVAEYVLPAGCKPTALAWATGNAGNVWWAAEGCGRIGWIVPGTGAVHTVEVNVGRPVSMAPNLGEVGVWFVDAASDRLGRLTATGGLSWFSPRVAGSRLAGVALGPDKVLYVTELAGNAIARFPLASFNPIADPNAGRLTDELTLPTAGAQPDRITAGTDGNVWFTQRGQARIGMVAMPTHCLVGKVTLADLLTPVPAVTVTLAPASGATSTTSTDAAGNFDFCGLADGGYTVTPRLAPRTFAPATRAVVLARSNLIATDFVAR